MVLNLNNGYTIKLCDLSALFNILFETNSHHYPMRPRLPIATFHLPYAELLTPDRTSSSFSQTQSGFSWPVNILPSGNRLQSHKFIRFSAVLPLEMSCAEKFHCGAS